jgi:hypothetical protein
MTDGLNNVRGENAECSPEVNSGFMRDPLIRSRNTGNALRSFCGSGHAVDMGLAWT